jgi:hypothetical protein
MASGALERYFGSDLAADRCLSAVILLEGPAVVRLWTAVTLRARIAAATWRMRRQRASTVRTFVAVPDLDAPVFVYELGVAASAYAARNLELSGGDRIPGVRRLLRWCMGCDPAAGAVIILGLRQ